ncbi:MAG TPA: glycosyltransferase [Thermoanaerobaculia bacterium]|jgi:glycosyltransferase involved in cell wall biosynthesis
MKLSVVMAVYNGERTLDATLDSILGQTMSDFELLVVDDGSTDATSAILTKHAMRDRRLRILTQPNAGLTRALIRGCAEATADVIARHDCGDRSHPERFARQLPLMAANVLTGCAVRYVTTAGELLYETHAQGDDVRRSLLQDKTSIRSLPHHGTAMFRRDAYLAAGGYRPQFRVAQDLDLWTRIARRGNVAIVPDVLYEATIEPGAISSIARDAQLRATDVIVKLRDGGSAPTLLAEASQITPGPRNGRSTAAAYYFIARCLAANRNPAARRYAWQAVRSNPLHWRAWLTLARWK